MIKPTEAQDPKAIAGERIIVALDVSSADIALEIVSELKDHAGAFKVGLQLFTSAGPAFVRKLVESGIKVFLDLKFHDIPNTVARAGVEAGRLGLWMFNVHALGGGEMMRRAADEVREVCIRENLVVPKIIGVTVLTSSDRETLAEVGIEGDVESAVKRLVALTADAGLDGVVASPHELKMIRETTGAEFLVVTPGIRPDFATQDDQKRVMTPSGALSAGSDYLVIGRPITDAADRPAALERILDEIRFTHK